MTDVRLIDVNAAIIDLREQIVAFFGEAKKKVKPEDYYITKLSAYHEDLEKLQIDNFIAYLNSRPTINPDGLRPRGRWIQRNKGHNNWVECSECNTVGSPFWKCCPVCTAMMDGRSAVNETL